MLSKNKLIKKERKNTKIWRTERHYFGQYDFEIWKFSYCKVENRVLSFLKTVVYMIKRTPPNSETR